MNVSGVSSLNFSSIGSIQSSTNQLPTTQTGNVANLAAAQPEISEMGSLMAELDQLKTSDPEQFKAKLGEIAEKIRADAGEQGGQAAKMLNGLADKFDEATETGDLSVLAPPSGGRSAEAQASGGKPPGGKPPGGPPPGGAPPAQASGAKSSKEESEDAPGAENLSAAENQAADTNGDGTISSAELARYKQVQSQEEEKVN